MLSRDAPFNEWLETGSHTFCPECRSPSIRVMRTLTATGPAFVAGVQFKLSAREQWVYHCPECGAEGKSEPKEGK